MPLQDLATIDAVLISHMHADHFFDLVPLRYALKYQVQRRTALPVLIPPGGMKTLHSIVSPFAKGGSFFDGIMKITEYPPNRPLHIGDAGITLAKTRHYIDAYAMRVGSGDRAAPEQRVVELARDADLFLCEAALGATGEERGRRGHCNAKEAAAMAAQAGVKHLVLTHYPAGVRPSDVKRAARSAFSGEITMADDGMQIALE
jgi:ribonuclease BN (tRNA processing enzyme)